MSKGDHEMTPDDSTQGKGVSRQGEGVSRGRVVLGMVAGVFVVGIAAFSISSVLAPSAKTGRVGVSQPASATGGGTATNDWSSDPHRSGEPVSAAAVERVRELRATLGASPEGSEREKEARRELARALIDSGDWVGGFNEARTLLRGDPDDEAGLLVEGLVRMRMGQNEEGLLLIDRLLAEHPNHVEALRVRGLGLLRTGDSAGAIASWERALAAAGGREPEIERLLAVSRSALGQTVSKRSGAAAAPGVLPVSVASVIGADVRKNGLPAPAAGGSESFPITVEAPGIEATGKTLFVSLVEEGGGPPVLVRRIVGPRFPLEIALSGADNMMGDGEVPATGTVRVRLDSDGNVGTREPRDLVAEVPARRGTTARVVLR